MGHLWQDLRFGARMLRKSPGFTLAAVLTLALGIGVNSAIFGVVNALLLRPLPVRASEELVTLSKLDDHIEFPHGMSYVDYLDLREQVAEFSDLMAYTFVAASLGTTEGAERTWISAVSGNYFSGLGVDVAVGRTFVPEEDQPYGDFPVLVLAHGMWQRRFGGDPGVVGRTVQLNGQPYAVIGVTSEGFQGTHSLIGTDGFAPLTSLERLRSDQTGALTERGAEGMFVIGRLAEGVTVADAQAAMQVQAARMTSAYPRTHVNSEYLVLLESRSRPEPSTSSVTPLVGTAMMGLAGLVLLIACANVAGLLIARGMARTREMALRAALGAQRGRLFAQLLSESLLLAMLGGAAGVVVALWVSRLLGGIRFAADIPIRFDASLDWRVLAFTAVATLVTGVVAGVSPAFRSARVDLTARLKEGGRGAADSPGGQRARAVLVVAQVAISLFLLVCSGLFIQSLRSAEQMDFGFRTENVLLFSVDQITQGYDEPRGRAVYREVAAEIARVPGVRSASWARYVAFGSTGLDMANFVSEDRTATSLEEPAMIAFNHVGADYFRTMDTTIRAGRGFEDEAGLRHDRAAARRGHARGLPAAVAPRRHRRPAGHPQSRVDHLSGHARRVIQELDADHEQRRMHHAKKHVVVHVVVQPPTQPDTERRQR
jgi:predicted permease